MALNLITKICNKGIIALCNVIKILGTGKFSLVEFGNLAPVVEKVDNAVQWINLYPTDIAIGFPNTYPLHSDLSGR